MEETKHIQIKDFNYELPEERIAKFPLPERDQSKLLVYRHGTVGEDTFTSLPDYLPQGALMVFNNTKVIQARLHFHKDTGALIEVFCLEPVRPHDYALMFQQTGRCSWLCLVGNLKKWKSGSLSRPVEIGGRSITLKATRGENRGTSHWIDFEWDDEQTTWAEILEAVGELPIPPYLNRETQESDKTTYQTVYSKIKGSVAAPTAGLHFTERVLADLDAHGIDREEVTLHVGAGTFLPVKDEDAAKHPMHTEHFEVRRATVVRLLEKWGHITAVGTTSVRTLESLAALAWRIRTAGTPDAGRVVGQWELYDIPAEFSGREALQELSGYMEREGLDRLKASTQIMITPLDYEFRIVHNIVTNFHQPKSTLLLLVSAFVGDGGRRIYDYALGHGFRFLSYGDSSVLLRE